MSKEFSIANRQLEPFGKWLHDLHLDAKESRVRTRFIELLGKQLEYIERERVELIRKYAKKDEEGSPIVVIDSAGRNLYDVPPEFNEKVNKEYNDLVNGNFVIPIDDSNREFFRALKDIVLETYYRFGPREGDPDNVRNAKTQLAMSYHLWAQSFDGLEV